MDFYLPKNVYCDNAVSGKEASSVNKMKEVNCRSSTFFWLMTILLHSDWLFRWYKEDWRILHTLTWFIFSNSFARHLVLIAEFCSITCKTFSIVPAILCTPQIYKISCYFFHFPQTSMNIRKVFVQGYWWSGNASS